MVLQSRFATNEKLRLCAVADEHHVGEFFSPVGPWVVLLKEALNAWAERQAPPIPPLRASDSFDQATGDRVALYKRMQSPPILNTKGQIDRIVGKKTVAALDQELPRLGEAPIASVRKVDVVVRFQGVGGTDHNQEFEHPGDVLPERLIMPYLARYAYTPDQAGKARVLKRLGARTVTTDARSSQLLLKVIQAIEGATSDGSELGVVCLWGSSSGGRNTLDLAHRLSLRGLPLTYVGVLDAAFFPHETGDRPSSPWNASRQPPPVFRLFHGIQADIRINHFQTVGNTIKVMKRPTGPTYQWTSTMPGEEIHGDVPGFQRKLVQSGLAGDDPHGALIARSRGEVMNDIAGILNAL